MKNLNRECTMSSFNGKKMKKGYHSLGLSQISFNSYNLPISILSRKIKKRLLQKNNKLKLSN